MQKKKPSNKPEARLKLFVKPEGQDDGRHMNRELTGTWVRMAVSKKGEKF